MDHLLRLKFLGVMSPVPIKCVIMLYCRLSVRLMYVLFCFWLFWQIKSLFICLFVIYLLLTTPLWTDCPSLSSPFYDALCMKICPWNKMFVFFFLFYVWPIVNPAIASQTAKNTYLTLLLAGFLMVSNFNRDCWIQYFQRSKLISVQINLLFPPE